VGLDQVECKAKTGKDWDRKTVKDRGGAPGKGQTDMDIRSVQSYSFLILS